MLTGSIYLIFAWHFSIDTKRKILSCYAVQFLFNAKRWGNLFPMHSFIYSRWQLTHEDGFHENLASFHQSMLQRSPSSPAYIFVPFSSNQILIKNIIKSDKKSQFSPEMELLTDFAVVNTIEGWEEKHNFM